MPKMDEQISPEEQLAQWAIRIAQDVQKDARALRAKLEELEVRKAVIVSKLNSLRQAPHRAEQFKPKIGNDFQCPECWVSGRQTVLRELSSQDDNKFECPVCPFTFDYKS